MTDTDIPGISLNETEGQVFLLSHPVANRPAVEPAALRLLLVQQGYGAWRLLDDAITSAVGQCNVQQETFGLIVAQRCDAVASVHVAADDMSATLSITAPQGGAPASREDLDSALLSAGVIFGIHAAALAQACNLGQCEGLLVASGLMPEHGQDTVFEEMVAHTVDREPKLDEFGHIDYREHGDIPVVHSGEALMRRIPPTPGVDGSTVRGHLLLAKPGRDEAFAPRLDGAELARDDPNLLQAAVSGQPVRVKCGITVEPILRLAEVNMASGNIHFDGTVHVSGEVLQGMKVQASGDIAVDGMVEGGDLEAGGNIRVAGGVIAKARLRAGGSVTARFAQGAALFAGTVIALEDMALECELQSLNQIIIGSDSAQRGRLLGGSATATMLLSVPILGSTKAGLTKVVLGSNPELDAKVDALRQRIAQEKATEANLEKLAKQLAAAGDPKGLLPRVKLSRQNALQVWGKSLAEQAELDQELARQQTARLEVTQGVAGAVDLVLGRATARLRRDFDAGSFFLDEQGQLVFADATGQAVPVI
jgi:uncharacterized protein (DUF342 family)